MRESFKRRKNFLPTVLITIITWGLWGLVFLKIPPDRWFVFVAFYFLLFLALFLTIALILANSRRGLLLSLATIVFLILRQQKLGSPLNIALLLVLFISLELYLSRR